MPNAAFEYSFLTENMAKDYKQELQWQKIFFIATSLALFICSLGIFGLSHLSTKQRMKEIGIRKVVGASTESILALLSKDFLKLVLLGFLAGTPFAIYLVKIGIEQYAYRISLQWWMLAIAFITIFFIAFFTILFETSKAALMNPVKSLKTE
jgi:putative ABC transport system permease protein